MQERAILAIFACVLAIIAVVFWPVLHGGFVWDDLTIFVYNPWLRYGDAWQHYVFRDFSYWTNYFRPLVVGLFTIEVRLSDTTPRPMHVVSLCLHILNTLLVGLLAMRMRAFDSRLVARESAGVIGIAMLAYGIHPAVVEPVAWIAAQFELVVVFFVLIGLLANFSIHRRRTRAFAVASCFFLAACAKEAAATFPLILALFDWFVLTRGLSTSITGKFSLLLRRSWMTYLACLLAGLAYLSFRHWALGPLFNHGMIAPRPVISRLQECVAIYLHYWRSAVWPMIGTSPINPFDRTSFDIVTMYSVAQIGLCIAILVTGAFLAARQASIIGCAILAMTLSLVPVLHIITLDFDDSLYHDRYLLLALAMVASLIAQADCDNLKLRSRMVKLVTPTAMILWLGLAVLNTCITIPLWRNNLVLWEWARSRYPGSKTANEFLLVAYMEAGDLPKARRIAARLITDHPDCAPCLLSAATAEVLSGNNVVASSTLDALQQFSGLADDHNVYESYLSLRGRIALADGHPAEAEPLLRAATVLNRFDSDSRYFLAIALAEQGKTIDAQNLREEILALSPAPTREIRRARLDSAIQANNQRH